MAIYESTYILRSDLANSDVEKISENFEKIISENKGKLLKKELWGLKNLSYKIHKNKKGYYVYMGFEAEAEAVMELKRKYKISEDVIRDLTIKVDQLNDNEINLDFED